MTLCGPCQSGKTFLINKLIENSDKMIETPPIEFLYFCTVHQPLYDEIIASINARKGSSLLQKYEFIDCSKKILPMNEINKLLGERTLLVLTTK